MASIEDMACLHAEGIDYDKLRISSHVPLLNISFTNEAVLILYRLAHKNVSLLRSWLFHLGGVHDGDGPDLLPYASLNKEVKKVKDKIRLFCRNRKKPEKEALLHDKFNLPSLSVSRLPAVDFVLATVKAASSVVCAAAVVVAEKETEAAVAKSVAAQSTLKADNLQALLGKTKRTLQNTKRQAKRAKLSASFLIKIKNSSLRTQKALVKSAAADKLLMAKLRLKLSRAKKCMMCPKKDELSSKQLNLISDLKQTIAELREVVKDSDALIAELNDAIKAADGVIQAKNGQSYSANMKQCILRLQALRVSQGAIGPAISAVLKTMVGRPLSNVPSRRTVGRLAPVGLALSQQQIAASLPNTSSATLYSDDTTKGTTKMSTYVVTGEDGDELVLGLKETVDKASLTQLNVLKVILAEIGGASSEENVMERIVASLKNLMSDRASTQVKFNSLFEVWRAECLPIARKDWAQLSLVERERLSSVNAFFCNLHLLANLAEKLTECMALLETGGDVPGELCSVVSLIRDVAKYFSSRSAAKWGIHLKWLDFLSLKGELNVPSIPSFLGHRFNILFLLAARIFQVRSLLIEFCTDYESINPTLATISPRLRDPFVVAQLKVLGLLDKCVTGPLWRLSESDIHILDMADQFSALLTWLGANILDPSAFLRGEPPAFSAAALRMGADSCLDALVVDSNEVMDEHLLSIAKPTLLVCQRYFQITVKDFLNEGKFSVANSGEIRQETNSVLKTNRIPESVFGLADWLFGRAPNMTMLTREALVLMIKNKTFAWFDQLSENGRTIHLRLATQQAAVLRVQYLQRKATMLAERQEKLKEAKEEGRRKRMRAVCIRSDLTKQVTVHGLWTNEIEVDSGLAKLSHTAKTKALKTQLNFRRSVLKQPADRKLFSFSESRQDHTWETLKANLIALIAAASRVAPVSDCLQIVGKRVSHRFEENGEERWWPGTCTRIVHGTGLGGSTVYLIVYDTDRQKEYTHTADELAVDQDNGDFILI
jgi:hypothetical protein